MATRLKYILAATILAAIGCGGAPADDVDGAMAGDLIAAEIAALERVKEGLSAEAQADIEAEIAALRAEAADLALEDAAPGHENNADIAAANTASATGDKNQQTPKGLPDGAWRVKPFNMMDRNGFDKPLVAGTILAPADWRDEGGVVWTPNDMCNSAGYNFSYKISSVNEQTYVTVFPTDRWFSSSNGSTHPMGCRTEPFDSAEAYLRGMIPRANAAAKIVSYRRREDMLAQLRQYESEMPMPGGGMKTWYDAGEATIEYAENGVQLREIVAVVVLFNESWLDAAYGMPGMRTIAGSTLPGFAYRAPINEFDGEFAETIRTSYVAGKEWSQRIAQHNAKINKTNIEGARKRAEITRRTNQEISDMMREGHREREAIRDRGHRESVEAIRGVETYDDPYAPGGTVELDHTYDNAWRLNDGTYVLTNDVDFQPFRDLGVDGEQLSPTP